MTRYHRIDMEECRISPGDPASSPLDQWEEHSAKIVFENPHKRALSDVCLDHPSLEGAASSEEEYLNRLIYQVPIVDPKRSSAYLCCRFITHFTDPVPRIFSSSANTFDSAFCMALSAASHASTSALTNAARDSTAAPASPFAQLLRNSRFATFDPQIRKTYTSPKQFVERGYWGLKRPITQRKKNSFVTIKTWEARQHYVEWDNGEDQVRFIRRMEELNVRPGHRWESAWASTLGSARHEWLVDSEFCPHEWDPVDPKARKGDAAQEANAQEISSEVVPPTQEVNAEEVAQEAILTQEEPTPFDSQSKIPQAALANRGPGGYGKMGMQRDIGAVMPNVVSMTPSEFKRYLAKLRTLRPAFREFLNREGEIQAAERKRWKEEQALRAALMTAPSPPPVSDQEDVPLEKQSFLQIAQNPVTAYHRRFLAQHTHAEYTSASNAKLQPQPHRNGALMYAHPSMVDTLFQTPRRPGIVLHDTAERGRFTDEPIGRNDDKHYVVSFAGMAATLVKSQADGRLPLMRPGVDRENWPTAVAEMRLTNNSPLMLHSVPRVVGPDPEGLDGVRVNARVTAKQGIFDPTAENPYKPGSRQYVAVGSLTKELTPRDFAPRTLPRDRRRNTSADAGADTGAKPTAKTTGDKLTNRPKVQAPVFKPPIPFAVEHRATAPYSSPQMQTTEQKAENSHILGVLSNLLKSPEKGGVSDSEM
ncbi:hypothetical protein DFH07DRAFT_1057330 [Mycena maculata]|uniref:Uncharacterized protein n=1 Tax=Mycena maculata TaxID=230809 RepID=A0AAD7JVP4_9AGAR|nr:hypothetical protein DFH07DRAFT_1057330 [Mycena maculata]